MPDIDPTSADQDKTTQRTKIQKRVPGINLKLPVIPSKLMASRFFLCKCHISKELDALSFDNNIFYGLLIDFYKDRMILKQCITLSQYRKQMETKAFCVTTEVLFSLQSSDIDLDLALCQVWKRMQGKCFGSKAEPVTTI